MNKATIESAGLELVAYLDADARFVWRKASIRSRTRI